MKKHMISPLFLATSLIIVGCSCNNKKKEEDTVATDSTIEVYETTGTKSKVLTRSNDLEFSEYSYSGNTEVHVSNNTDWTYDGFGCAIRVDANEAVFGTWRPVGATILRETVTTNEDVIELLKKTGDIISYKRKIEQKS